MKQAIRPEKSQAPCGHPVNIDRHRQAALEKNRSALRVHKESLQTGKALKNKPGRHSGTQ